MSFVAKTDLRACLTLIAVFAVTTLLYWPGLTGPFLLDDYASLRPISRWHSGLQTWQLTMLPNPDSFVESRPLAMLSFMLSAWLGDGSIFSLKLGNLIVHLGCGLVILALLQRVLKLEPLAGSCSRYVALILTAFWLLHPLQVSTVLYMVQRMAQLSTLFSLAAVLVYVIARTQQQDGRVKIATFHLFCSLPALVVLGVLGKQNAAVAPALCLVIELAYFAPRARIPSSIWKFHALFVGLPILAAITVLLAMPERVLGGYAEWDFTLWERVLTQPRVLFNYIGMWFVPHTPAMGLYSDDFPISQGLLSPLSTLTAILGLASLSVLAILLRNRSPSIFAGWFFFLIAHSVESSILPLEMHYEHRNYLPSVGLILAGYGLVSMAAQRLQAPKGWSQRSKVLIVSSLIAVLAFATFGRVLIWKDEISILQQGLAHHPGSLRVHLDLSAYYIRAGEFEEAGRTMRPLLQSPDARNRLVARMDLAMINCMAGLDTDPVELARAMLDAQPKVTVAEVHVALLQEAATREGTCTSIPPEAMAKSLIQLIDKATAQDDAVPTKITIRRLAAQLYVHAKLWAMAQQQAEIAWSASHSLPAGALLTQLYIKSGDRSKAERVIDVMGTRVRKYDNLWQGEIERLRARIATMPVSVSEEPNPVF